MTEEKFPQDRLAPSANEAMISADYFRSPLDAIANRYYPNEYASMDNLQLGEIWRRI